MTALWDGLCTAGWLLAAALGAIIGGAIIAVLYVLAMLLAAVVAVASMPVAIVALITGRRGR